MMMEPSSDDDDGSSVDEDEQQQVVEEERGGSNDDALLLSNFDDLPTDDSEDEDDDSEEDDDDGTSSDDGSSIDTEDDISDVIKEQKRDVHSNHDEDATPLGERVAYEAGVGRRYHRANNDKDEDNNNNDGGGRGGGRAERKNRAIELASERLKQMRSQKSNNNATTTERRSETKRDKLSDDNDDDSVDDDDEKQQQQQQSRNKKKSKHAPTEMSSKRQDYFARGRPDLNSSGIGVSIGANRYRARDPRTESLSGHLDVDAFDKRYEFLDTMQETEIDILKRRVNAWKTSGKKGQKIRRKLGMNNNSGGGIESSLELDQEELTRLLQERAERTRANIVRTAKRSVKDKLKANVATGKHGAYYPKRSELRKMETEAKFEELRKRGGESAVDAVIAKRRKKNLAKEAKSMPSHKIK
jgi:ribosomal RNA-processing protein 36